jgi:heme-degrading monooxygenase HmoA
MFVALWEFEVKPGCEERFEKVYGPDGEWAKLFRSDSCYIETRLVKDTFRRGAYLTMDFWQSRKAYQAFLASHKSQYQAMDAQADKLTSKECRIGWYELVSP